MPQPNVLFIIADQHRWDFIGYETNGVTQTPHLDRIGREGTIFRSAYCTAPLCSPSRAAIAAGRYGMNSGCFTNLHELPPGTLSFVQQLRSAGYRTSAVGKTHMEIHAYNANYTSAAHKEYMDSLGWDDICEISGNGMLRTGIRCACSEFLRERGALMDVVRFYKQWHYFMEKEKGGDPDFTCHEWTLPPEYRDSHFVGTNAREWLRNRNRSQPFFLHVGFAAPHSPIDPLPEFMDRYRDADETPAWNNPSPSEALADARRGYRAMITEVDHWVGKLRDELDAQGILDNTIIIYTADHGEMAGDQNLAGKTRFFEASVRVPMLIAGPGIQSGQDSSALVEVIDVGKTICDLCGVEPHQQDQGKSLVPVLTAESDEHRDTVYAEMGCDRMLCDGRYKLMWGDPGSDTRLLGRLHLDKPVNIPPSPCRLYDLTADPHEEHDLAPSVEHRDILAEMKEKLFVRINENVQTQPNKSRGEYRPLRS